MSQQTAPVIQKRYDFVLLFDVQDGNPNGDPDAGNLPRTDPETGHGLVTDVALKRKVRNYVLLTAGADEGCDIFVKEKAVLNEKIAGAYTALGVDLDEAPLNKADGAKRKDKGQGQGGERDKARTWMCQRYFDVRTFGAVLSTGANAGQVRGPVQFTFGRSIQPIIASEHSITRMAVTDEKEAEKQGGDNRTMGRKFTVPYGLYRAHGFVSPSLAKQTGFSESDLDRLWSALESMFEHDRSAARGLMSTRHLVVFEHSNHLGDAPAHKLFDRVQVATKSEAARSFADYAVTLDGQPVGDDVRITVAAK